jgi:hypothetical protein
MTSSIYQNQYRVQNQGELDDGDQAVLNCSFVHWLHENVEGDLDLFLKVFVAALKRDMEAHNGEESGSGIGELVRFSDFFRGLVYTTMLNAQLLQEEVKTSTERNRGWVYAKIQAMLSSNLCEMYFKTEFGEFLLESCKSYLGDDKTISILLLEPSHFNHDLSYIPMEVEHQRKSIFWDLHCLKREVCLFILGLQPIPALYGENGFILVRDLFLTAEKLTEDFIQNPRNSITILRAMQILLAGNLSSLILMKKSVSFAKMCALKVDDTTCLGRLLLFDSNTFSFNLSSYSGVRVQWYYYRQHHNQHRQKYGAQEYEKIKTNTAVVDSVLNLSYTCHERMVKAFTINTRPSLSDTILSQALKKILTNAFKETHPATALGELQGFWYGFPGNVRAATDTAAKTDTAVNAISGWRLRPSLDDDSYSPYCKESREVMPPAKTVTRYGRVSRRPERWGVSYF